MDSTGLRSPLVTRGSAPDGTFHIPDEGLQVPQEDSFLFRFLASRSQKVEQPAGELEVVPARPTTPVDPGVDKITSAVARVIVTDDVDAKSTSDIAHVVNARHTNGHTFKMEVSSEKQESDNENAPDEITPNPVVERKTEPVKLPSTSITAEQKADEVEDTLIKVAVDSDSLLSEVRASYPILRFCAAKGLLDQQALDKLGLPLGFMWSPFGELPNIELIERAPKRCGTCGSFLAKDNGADPVLQGSRVWTCGFCGRNDNDPGEAGFDASVSPQAYPELSTDTVEYIHPRTVPPSSPGRGAIILIVDENLNPEEAEWARAAAKAVHASAAEKGLRFSLFAVGAGCSVAVRHSEGETPIMEMMGFARASKLTAQEKEHYFLDPPGEGSSGYAQHTGAGDQPGWSMTDSLINPRATVVLDQYKPGLVEEEGDTKPEPLPKTRLPPEMVEYRRLDLALFIAFQLIASTADSDNSRILSLITGPPTLAQHARQAAFADKNGVLSSGVAEEARDTKDALAWVYEKAGARAGEMRIALDFLCFGAPHGFGGNLLLAAAKRSRGGLVYTAAHSFSSWSALAEAATFLAERSTNPGVVSIRVSSPLSVARVIGPAFPTAAPHTYAVPGIDPLTGFTVILKAADGAMAEEDLPTHAVVQLAAKSLETTRVVTVKMPVSKISSDYLTSLDPEICALILGKACVVSGGALTRPSIAASSIDVSARRLLEGSEASAGVVRLLYELRRGLLIGQHVHPDCALALRSFFLRAECGIASLLLSPRLFTNTMSDESTGLMAEVPLERTFVTEDAVVVLDTGFNVFVYIGKNASAEAEEAISESARSVAAQRMTPCQLWKLREGKGAEYVLGAYLSPDPSIVRKLRVPPSEKGFIEYCKSLAPDSVTVRALQGA